ncbi:MAG: hypothetical protein ABJ327_02320, partial [Litoreibacter sp.]
CVRLMPIRSPETDVGFGPAQWLRIGAAKLAWAAANSAGTPCGRRGATISGPTPICHYIPLLTAAYGHAMQAQTLEYLYIQDEKVRDLCAMEL